MKKINLGITGCLGRMGQQLMKSSQKDINFKLVSLTENRLVNNKYYGIFEINFNKNKILNFLRNKNIFHSRMIEKNVLFVPVFFGSFSYVVFGVISRPLLEEPMWLKCSKYLS